MKLIDEIDRDLSISCVHAHLNRSRFINTCAVADKFFFQTVIHIRNLKRKKKDFSESLYYGQILKKGNFLPNFCTLVRIYLFGKKLKWHPYSKKMSNDVSQQTRSKH